jgi:hypothetical protein
VAYARYRGLINLALAIVTILGIGVIKEPADLLAPVTFFGSLYSNGSSYVNVNGRWPLMILFIIFAYDVILQFTLRRRPFDVIRTTATITFPQNCSHVSTINRTQALRANRPGIQAYHMRVSALPGGKVPKEQLKIRYHNNQEEFRVTRLIVGSESSWDIVEQLAKPLPFNLLLPSLPNWLLRLIRSPCIVQRAFDSHYVEPSDQSEYYFGLIADRYPHKNVTIRMILPVAIDLRDKVKAVKIRDNSVENLPVSYPEPTSASEYVIETNLKNLNRGERLRLIWPQFTAASIIATSSGPIEAVLQHGQGRG